MHNILQKIIAQRKKDIEEAKKKFYSSSEDPEIVEGDESRSKTIDSSRLTSFARTIKNAGFAIIAEVKLASPTEGRLSSTGDLVSRVKQYEQGGADAISIVTEKHFFKGDIGFVSQIKKITHVPVLQKDFIIDEYQIYEAKTVHSDALLLIARIVSKKKLQQFVTLSQKLGIEPVVEIHNQEDLQKAVATKTRFIAVNARDLNTFVVDVKKACRLIKKIPNKFIKLGFSGIKSNKEVKKYQEAGAKGVLVGTSLMKAKNIFKFLMSLRATEGSAVI